MRQTLPGCCARAAIGHAAVPPTRIMNSRRLMPNMGLAPVAHRAVIAGAVRLLNLQNKFQC
jgi:hypothetical protein